MRFFIEYHCLTQIKIESVVVFAVRKIICLHVFVVAWTFLPFFVAGSFVAFLLHVGFPFLLHQLGCKLSKAPISSKKKLFWQNSFLRNLLVFSDEITLIWIFRMKLLFYTVFFDRDFLKIKEDMLKLGSMFYFGCYISYII